MSGGCLKGVWKVSGGCIFFSFFNFFSLFVLGAKAPLELVSLIKILQYKAEECL